MKWNFRSSTLVKLYVKHMNIQSYMLNMCCNFTCVDQGPVLNVGQKLDKTFNFNLVHETFRIFHSCNFGSHKTARKHVYALSFLLVSKYPSHKNVRNFSFPNAFTFYVQNQCIVSAKERRRVTQITQQLLQQIHSWYNGRNGFRVTNIIYICDAI